MSYQRAKQVVSGTIPPWQKVLDSVQHMGAGAFIPKSGDELRDIPNAAASVAADYTTIPFTDIGPRKFMDVPEPQTEYGENLKFAGNMAPLAFGGMAAAKGIDDLMRAAEINKVKKIQQAFGPWVKRYTTEYGNAFRGGIKDVIKTTPKQDLAKQVQRSFNPLRRSDSYKDLPVKTQAAIEKVYSPNASTRDVLNAANRLRKSPAAKKYDEAGNLVRDTGKKLKSIVKQKSPKFAEVDREYGEFSGVRDVMEKFKPGQKGQGDYGTSSGTRILRDINKRQPGDIKAMQRFGDETGMNIVGPAKIAANARGIGSVIQKSLPYAIGIGAPGYLIAKKLLNNQAGYQPYGG